MRGGSLVCLCLSVCLSVSLSPYTSCLVLVWDALGFFGQIKESDEIIAQLMQVSFFHLLPASSFFLLLLARLVVATMLSHQCSVDLLRTHPLCSWVFPFPNGKYITSRQKELRRARELGASWAAEGAEEDKNAYNEEGNADEEEEVVEEIMTAGAMRAKAEEEEMKAQAISKAPQHTLPFIHPQASSART
jgi:hypothetical protein